MLSQVREIERYLILAFAAILATGVGLILVGLRTSYEPIARLVRVVSTAFGVDPQGNDEVTFVQRAFTTTADSNRLLHRRVDSLKPLLREYVLRELIGSGTPFIGDPSRISLLLGPEEVNESVHVIVVIACPTAKIRQAVLDGFQKMRITATLTITPIETESDGFLILLFTESSNDRSRLRSSLERIIAYTSSVDPLPGGDRPAVGTGTYFRDILDAGQSYAAAMEQLYSTDHDGFVASPDRWSADANRSVSDPGWIARSASERLTRHLEAGDLASIRHGLKKARSELGVSNSPQFFSRCMIYDLFNTVLRTASEKQIDIQTVLGPDTHLFIARTHQTIDTLLVALERACVNLASLMVVAEPSGHQLITQALALIQDQHTDRNFSVESAASTLGVTVPYLSRSFKEYRGETISEHVWSLRLTRAREMLSDSHATVREIAYAVGYTDVSAFIRRFHKETGLSPGRYRMQAEPTREPRVN